MTPEELIMEKWRDTQKRSNEREDVAELKVYNFFKWLQGEYEKDEQ